MLDTFQASESIGKGSKRCSVAANGDQFKAHVRPEMDVCRRDDARFRVMLDLCELLRKPVHMVVIEQCDHADDFALFIPLVFDELSSDGITNRLGATAVASLVGHVVESGHQFLFHGYAETDGLIQVTPL